MAQAALNIDGLAFCTLDIENASVPPSMNMIETILIMDGFGMGLPVMRMRLYDEDDKLSRDLNLKNGTLVTIRLGKSAQEAPSYKYRVFGWSRTRSSTGKILSIVLIFDAPKFGAGAYSEYFEGATSLVMQQMAELSGLKYDGPAKTTDDNQNWLNLNTTRLAFSEDVAMRGYANDQSCMARLVSMDGTLIYKDLMALLNETPKFSLAHNTDGAGGNGKVINVRAAKDKSVAGLFTHYVNYGHKSFGHSFEDEFTAIETLDVKAQGAGLPVNPDVLAQLQERGSRVSYTGLDYGTGPEEGFNVHEHYERAYYQNVRLLSLFSERLVAITDSATELRSFSAIEFNQGAGAKGSSAPTPADVTGKYIVGGKCVVIKNGTKYSEVFYLYRPFIGEAGNTNGTSAAKTQVKASNSGVDTSSRNFT